MDVIIFLQTTIIATNFLIMENKNKKTLQFSWPYKRKNYVLYFNECLKEKCQKNNWIFIDIYKYYADNNGFLNKLMGEI